MYIVSNEIEIAEIFELGGSLKPGCKKRRSTLMNYCYS